MKPDSHNTIYQLYCDDGIFLFMIAINLITDICNK